MHKEEEKKRDQKLAAEKEAGGFKCIGCGEWVAFSDQIGTAHRNHCPFCFASKHVDLKTSGDRVSGCGGRMDAIGLTFKHEGMDKYGKPRPGELMLIHECSSCGKVSINRIAGDDSEEALMALFEKSLKMGKERMVELGKQDINILSEKDRDHVKKALPSQYIVKKL